MTGNLTNTKPGDQLGFSINVATITSVLEAETGCGELDAKTHFSNLVMSPPKKRQSIKGSSEAPVDELAYRQIT